MQFSSCTTVGNLVAKFKMMMISCEMIKHSCKWEIVACNCKLNGYLIKKN